MADNDKGKGGQDEKKVQRDFSNTGRDSTFSEKWKAAFNEFECFREEVRNRLGVEFCVRGKIGLIDEEARSSIEDRSERKEVRKDQKLEL